MLDVERPRARLGIGPIEERFDGVGEIAVLRGGGLGDLLYAVPAIEALAAAYPTARITLLGSAVHAELLEGRFPAVAAVAMLPVARGVREGVEDVAAIDAFVEGHRGRYDLGVQVHGGGRFSNPFLRSLDPPHSVGARTPDAAALERNLPYLYYQHEVLRALEIVGLAGAAPVALEPRLLVRDRDRDRARRLAPVGSGPLIVVHPGAADPRRRWPAERFAEVVARLAGQGCRVVLVGDAAEVTISDHILSRLERLGSPNGTVVSLAGRIGIGELVGILAEAEVFLGNDSGPRHLAQAVGTPTAAVYWFGNLVNAGPLGRARNRIQLSWTTSCPVCGRDATQVGWTAERCAHEVSFVADVAADAVFRDVTELMATTPPPDGR